MVFSIKLSLEPIIERIYVMSISLELPIFIGVSRILKFSVILRESSKAVGHRSGLPSIPNSTDFLT